MAIAAARLNNGVVELNSVTPPAPIAAGAPLLRGFDGGDWRTGRWASHPPRAADGGDFDGGVIVLLPMAQSGDGGSFSPLP